MAAQWKPAAFPHFFSTSQLVCQGLRSLLLQSIDTQMCLLNPHVQKWFLKLFLLIHCIELLTIHLLLNLTLLIFFDNQRCSFGPVYSFQQLMNRSLQGNITNKHLNRSNFLFVLKIWLSGKCKSTPVAGYLFLTYRSHTDITTSWGSITYEVGLTSIFFRLNCKRALITQTWECMYHTHLKTLVVHKHNCIEAIVQKTTNSNLSAEVTCY